ncbi:hypothetical protein NKT34_13745 [Paenibacillus polysaccharolyticus]|uniref:hypothetical protein n=1 Tax=Paenibacillus polysaccharolyticus TaxID=582692 RepID=UPI00209F80B6|nr:hypothetical protein [Paenibacillus polysaccharolyticus]MCP1134363.1 hypothetical protein [Paenibacillus polysaccharolyticus]
MQVGHASSSESKRCVVCGKKTNNYKTYEQSDMVITIPACVNEVGDCYDQVDVRRLASRSLTDIKKNIKG